MGLQGRQAWRAHRALLAQRASRVHLECGVPKALAVLWANQGLRGRRAIQASKAHRASKGTGDEMVSVVHKARQVRRVTVDPRGHPARSGWKVTSGHRDPRVGRVHLATAANRAKLAHKGRRASPAQLDRKGLQGLRDHKVHMVFQVIVESEGPKVRVANLDPLGPPVFAVCQDTPAHGVIKAHQDRWGNRVVLDRRGAKALHPKRQGKWIGRSRQSCRTFARAVATGQRCFASRCDPSAVK